MQEKTTITMRERVTVSKFDHTHEDHPTVPVDVIVQETISEISPLEALLLGWQPTGEIVESSGTLHLGEVTNIGTCDGAPVVGE